MRGVTDRPPKWPLFTLLAMQALQLLSLFPWLMIAGLSFMVFDAPGSEKKQGSWLFVGAVWSYPLWLIVAAAISWPLLTRRHQRSALILGSVFTVPAVLLLGWPIFLLLLARS